MIGSTSFVRDCVSLYRRSTCIETYDIFWQSVQRGEDPARETLTKSVDVHIVPSARQLPCSMYSPSLRIAGRSSEKEANFLQNWSLQVLGRSEQDCPNTLEIVQFFGSYLSALFIINLKILLGALTDCMSFENKLIKDNHTFHCEMIGCSSINISDDINYPPIWTT